MGLVSPTAVGEPSGRETGADFRRKNLTPVLTNRIKPVLGWLAI
jgi:hypothetical protein